MDEVDDINFEDEIMEENSNKNIKFNFVSSSGIEQHSKASGFSAAFSKMKDSEFYETPPELPSASSEKGPVKISSKNSIIVNSRQRGNPILKFIRNVPWEYGDVIPDYVLGATTCAMFLSMRYHVLNPNYIHDRLKVLGQRYNLRVLLVQIDMKDRNLELKQLSKICFYAGLTLMLAWSPEEAGTILEGYKVFENKPPDLIMEKQEQNTVAQVVDALTSIKGINRTDAMTLLSNFGSLEKIFQASIDELSFCPGLGPQKATKLHSVLRQSFKK